MPGRRMKVPGLVAIKDIVCMLAPNQSILYRRAALSCVILNGGAVQSHQGLSFCCCMLGIAGMMFAWTYIWPIACMSQQLMF